MSVLRWLFWWRAPCLLRTVIINMKDDDTTAIRGVLWQSRGPWFTVADAQLLKAGLPPTRIDGSVVLHRDNVSFIQVVP